MRNLVICFLRWSPRAGELAAVPTIFGASSPAVAHRPRRACATQCGLVIHFVRQLKQPLCHSCFEGFGPIGVESDDDTWSDDEMLSLSFVTNFGDETFAHQAAGDKPRSVVVHFL